MNELNFSELIKKVNKEKTIHEFLEWCDEDPYSNEQTRSKLSDAIDTLRSMEPVCADGLYVIHIGMSEDEDRDYNYAYLLVENREDTYSFEVQSWGKVLGYEIFHKDVDEYNPEYLAALILWEITWFGYDECTIKSRFEEIYE